MFAPPPIQLSLAQIQEEKLRREEREAERQKAAAVKAQQSSTGSLARVDTKDSRTSRRTGLFARRRESKSSEVKSESKPKEKGKGKQIVSDPTPSLKIGLPIKQQESAGLRAERKGQDSISSSSKSGKAAAPRRPARPPADILLPQSSQKYSVERRAAAASIGPAAAAIIALGEKVLPPSSGPPPIPAKSPRRAQSVLNTTPPLIRKEAGSVKNDTVSAPEGWVFRKADEPNRPAKASSTSIPFSNASGAHRSNTSVPQSPSSPKEKYEEERASRPTSMNSIEKRLSEVQEGKVRKSMFAAKRAYTVPLVSRARKGDTSGIEQEKGKRPKTEFLATKRKTASSYGISPLEIQMPWRRRGKGESMSMLISSGFFCPDMLEHNYEQLERPEKGEGISVVTLSVMDREPPDTPGSFVKTPTEMYPVRHVPLTSLPFLVQRVPRVARGRGRSGRRVSTKKSSWAKVATINQSNESWSTGNDNQLLKGIPEILTTENYPGNSNAASGISTPIATEIHLRSGSVLTVAPPEMEPWKRTIYIHGPIRIANAPIARLRSASITSLDPFQAAVDQVYHGALIVPRRDSEIKVLDDLCEWFEGFGFVQDLHLNWTLSPKMQNAENKKRRERENIQRPLLLSARKKSTRRPILQR